MADGVTGASDGETVLQAVVLEQLPVPVKTVLALLATTVTQTCPGVAEFHTTVIVEVPAPEVMVAVPGTLQL